MLQALAIVAVQRLLPRPLLVDVEFRGRRIKGECECCERSSLTSSQYLGFDGIQMDTHAGIMIGIRVVYRVL